MEKQAAERREDTMQALQLAVPRGEVQDPRDRVAELLEAFTSRRSETTRKAYETDLQDFTRYTERENVQAAIWALISEGPGRANSIALHYKNSMTAAGKSPATVNRRLSALRSVVTMARTLGIVTWSLEVGNERTQTYRDTRGPGRCGVRALLDAVDGPGPKAIRDRAIIRLMYGLALRRGEVVTLRLEDVDLEGRRLWISGKGRGGEREVRTLPPHALEALQAWISVRGNAPGALFINYHHDAKVQGKGITGAGVWHLIRTLGGKAGISTRPHGIRHTAITEALDRTKDARAVRRFSRHMDLATVLRYDDNREDLAGQVAAVVDAAL